MEPWEELGMDQAQYAEFKRLTTGFPHHDENGADISLLRENLKLSPEQRFAKMLRRRLTKTEAPDDPR